LLLQLLVKCDLLESASSAVETIHLSRSAIVNFLPLSLMNLSLAALLCTAAAAHADVTVYTDRAAFLAAVSMPGTDTFNDLAAQPYGTPLSRSAGAYGYQASAGPVSDFYPAGGGSDVWLATNSASDTITFSNFASGVRAFGGNFFGTDIDGAFTPGRTMVLSATDGANIRTTVNLYDTNTATFLGFISSDPLASVTLRPDGIPGSVYWATANDVTLGMVPQVPEPASFGMLLAGLGLVGFAVRRRAG
jgi:hypothetical protein